MITPRRLIVAPLVVDAALATALAVSLAGTGQNSSTLPSTATTQGARLAR
ncbi:MAG: hypothetical protein ABSC90_16370 [Acidimicrobiales bacterium]